MENSIFELSLKYKKKKKPQTVINQSDIIEKKYRFLFENIELYEQFFLVCVDSSFKDIGYSLISTGDTSSTIASPRKILMFCLLSNCTGAVLLHNHPGGMLEPSKEDLTTTDKIKELFKLCNITLHDHIILTNNNNYYSFAEHGKI